MSEKSKQLLKELEENPVAFTSGRRNDDVCNWFFAKFVTLRGDGETITLHRILNDFHTLIEKLSQTQRDHMRYWDEDADAKLEYCFTHYQEYSDDYLLEDLWVLQG